MKDNKLTILTILFSAIVLGSTYFYLGKSEVKTTEVKAKNTLDVFVATFPKNEIAELDTNSYRSKVRDTKYIELTAGREGLLQSLNVNIGDKVSAGQILATVYHTQSQEAAASLRIEARKAEIDAEIAKQASINLKKFNDTYNQKLKGTIQTSQNNINNSVDNFVNNSLNSSTNTASHLFNINKTLEQDIREIQEKISTNKLAGSKIDSNLQVKNGISAIDSGYLYQYINILTTTKYDGNVTDAYQNANNFYSATLRLLNSSSGSDGFTQSEINSLKDKIVDRIAGLASNYKDINQVVLDSIKAKYETEVAKANTNLDLQKTLLSAEREIEQNNIEIQKLEAQANLYPEAYKNGLGDVLYTTYAAPFDGIVSSVPLQKGSLVSLGDVVVSVQGANGIRTAVIEVDPNLDFTKEDSLLVYDPIKPFQKWSAKIIGSGIAVNKKGLKIMQIEIPKDANLLSNQTIRVRLKSHSHIEIPLTAVVTFENNTYVWKVTENGLTKSKVILGEIVNNKVMVEEGVSEGDKIVSYAKDNLQEGQTIEVSSRVENTADTKEATKVQDESQPHEH